MHTVCPWCGHANCSRSPYTRVAIHCVLRSTKTHIYKQPRACTHYACLGRHLYGHLEAHDHSPKSQPTLDYRGRRLLPVPPLLPAPPPPTRQGCLLLAIYCYHSGWKRECRGRATPTSSHRALPGTVHPQSLQGCCSYWSDGKREDAGASKPDDVLPPVLRMVPG